MSENKASVCWLSCRLKGLNSGRPVLRIFIFNSQQGKLKGEVRKQLHYLDDEVRNVTFWVVWKVERLCALGNKGRELWKWWSMGHTKHLWWQVPALLVWVIASKGTFDCDWSRRHPWHYLRVLFIGFVLLRRAALGSGLWYHSRQTPRLVTGVFGSIFHCSGLVACVCCCLTPNLESDSTATWIFYY